MAQVFNPATGQWEDPQATGPGLRSPQSVPLASGVLPGQPASITYQGHPVSPTWDYNRLTPAQQQAFQALPPDQKYATMAMGNPPAGFDISKYFGGAPTPAGSPSGAAPSLPSSNGAAGSHDTATIQAWLKSQGVADKDIQYYTDQINSKSDGLSQANADYWSGKINGGGSGGGGGFGGLYGPQNTFTPLSPFQGIGNAPSSSYNPGGISAPSPFQYQPIQGNQPFSFPGVYQLPAPPPPAPIASAPTAQSVPPPPNTVPPTPPPNAGPDPFAAMGGGVYIAEKGQWLPSNNPEAQAYVAQHGTPDPAAQQAYQQAQAAQTPAIGAPSVGSSGGGNAAYYAPGGPGGPPITPGGQIGSSNPNEGVAPQIGSSNPNEGVAPQIGVNRDPAFTPAGVGTGDGPSTAWYYAPGGPGGPPAIGQNPDPQAAPQIGTSTQQPAPPPVGSAPPSQPGSLYAAGLTMSPYQAPSPFSSAPVPQLAGFTQTGQITAPSLTAPTPLAYDPLTAPAAFQAGTFQAPTPEEAANDPGYKFALDQAQQALQQSAAARGGLNSTGTQKALSDYTQAAAGQQYQNVYARDLAAFQAQQALNQGAYGLNASTGLAYQGQGYAQAANTQGQNAGQNLAVQQANAGNALQAQQNSYANALAGYQTNAATQLGAQQQAYAQGANTYSLNAQTGQNAYALNAQTQLGAQNQAFNQAFNVYNANNANSLALQQANFQNAYNVYQGNFGNQLNAFNASTTAGQNAAALNAQTAQNAWMDNYTQAWNAYQSQVQQQEAAAGLGFQYAGLGLQQQNQLYNQAANTYGINYNALYQQPFNNALSVAGLGINAANSLNGAAGGYGANAGNIYSGIGNSLAAGQVGAANATAGGIAGLANGLGSLGWYYGTQPRTTQPAPFNPGSANAYLDPSLFGGTASPGVYY